MEQSETDSQLSMKEKNELEKYKKNLHSNIFLYDLLNTYVLILYFLDLVVAYKKLTLEKNALEETLKASSNYDKDDISETDNSEVQQFILHYSLLHFYIYLF